MWIDQSTLLSDPAAHCVIERDGVCFLCFLRSLDIRRTTMFVGALTLAALAFTPVVLADGYLNGLLHALNASCLDHFANATASLNSTPTGQHVLTQLSQGNKTIFAPTDDACVLLLKTSYSS